MPQTVATPSAQASDMVNSPSLDWALEKNLPIHFSQEELGYMASTPVKTFLKGDFLLKEGQVSTNCYHVVKGCIREFYLLDGEEQTAAFYLEGDSISADNGMAERTPSKYYWECLEDCTLAVVTNKTEKEMYRRFPRLESLCRMVTENKFGQYREAVAHFIYSTPEQRYLHILENRPGLLDRVPQYQLASFIGVKPESLSRIRGRILKRR